MTIVYIFKIICDTPISNIYYIYYIFLDFSTDGGHVGYYRLGGEVTRCSSDMIRGPSLGVGRRDSDISRNSDGPRNVMRKPLCYHPTVHEHFLDKDHNQSKRSVSSETNHHLSVPVAIYTVPTCGCHGQPHVVRHCSCYHEQINKQKCPESRCSSCHHHNGDGSCHGSRSTVHSEYAECRNTHGTACHHGQSPVDRAVTDETQSPVKISSPVTSRGSTPVTAREPSPVHNVTVKEFSSVPEHGPTQSAEIIELRNGIELCIEGEVVV